MKSSDDYNDIDVHYKYQGLFELLEQDNESIVDTVIVTGGRYSLKSFTISVFALSA